MERVGIKGQAGGFASAAFVSFFEQPYSNAKEAALAVIPTLDFAQDVHLELLNQGVYPITRGLVVFVISTPMDEQKIDQIIKRFESALALVKPMANEIQS
jgi:glutamate-1-semialdehyde aminotransferase